MSNDMIMMQAIGEIKEANKSIANTMDIIKDNLKILNDNNVLHDNKAESRQNMIINKLEVLTTKYWWLIVVLLGAVFVVLGYKEAIKFF